MVNSFQVFTKKSNGADKVTNFPDQEKAFDFFHANLHKSALITSDDLMGTFSPRDIQGFPSRLEGKDTAHRIFSDFVKYNRR